MKRNTRGIMTAVIIILMLCTSGVKAGSLIGDIPAAPASLKAADIGYNTVVLTWESSGRVADGYRIYYTTTDPGERRSAMTMVGITDGGTTSFTITGLTEGTRYYLGVTAYNLYGESGLRSVLSIVTKSRDDLKTGQESTNTRYPKAPALLRAGEIAVSGVTLVWNKSDNADGYRVYSSTKNPQGSRAKMTMTGTTNGEASWYRVGGLEPDSTYYFAVAAYNSHGVSDISKILACTTQQVSMPPTPTEQNSHNGVVSAVAAKKDYILRIEEEELALSEDIINIDGRTMFPLRAFFEILGAGVEWEQDTMTAEGKKGRRQVEFTIGSTEYVADGVSKSLDVPAQLLNNKTYVPIRAAAESMGYIVDYDDGVIDLTYKTLIKSILDGDYAVDDGDVDIVFADGLNLREDSEEKLGWVLGPDTAAAVCSTREGTSDMLVPVSEMMATAIGEILPEFQGVMEGRRGTYEITIENKDISSAEAVEIWQCSALLNCYYGSDGTRIFETVETFNRPEAGERIWIRQEYWADGSGRTKMLIEDRVSGADGRRLLECMGMEAGGHEWLSVKLTTREYDSAGTMLNETEAGISDDKDMTGWVEFEEAAAGAFKIYGEISGSSAGRALKKLWDIGALNWRSVNEETKNHTQDKVLVIMDGYGYCIGFGRDLEVVNIRDLVL